MYECNADNCQNNGKQNLYVSLQAEKTFKHWSDMPPLKNLKKEQIYITDMLNNIFLYFMTTN